MSKKAIFILFVLFFTFIQKFGFSYDLTAVQNILSAPQNQKTISMDFKEALLADVLKIFSQQSGLNFISASDISGKKINLYLEKVPVEEALERILTANSLTYEIKPDSNIFLVKKLVQSDKDLMTRIYPLKYATVSTSKLKNSVSSSTSANSSEGGGGSSASGGNSSGLINSIKAVLTPDGSVHEDNRTNSLIITDVPSQFLKIENVLSRLDIRIPQILIEVEMLDISKGTADLLGVKYSETIATGLGASKDNIFPFNAKNLFQTIGTTDPSSQYTTGSISFTDFKFTLQFLKSQSDTKSLARPRILTLNNEPAEIKIETDEAIQVDTTNDPDANTSTTTVTRETTGVSLRVVPQANLLTNEITLSVEPTVTDTKTSSLITNTSSIKDPEQRTSKSMLRIKNGDTVVLGGLLRSESTDGRTSIPGISNIPLIGAAFRHKDKSEKQRELIIFITPHIVDEQNDASELSSTDTFIDREQSLPK